jgi:hypothetical protein
MKANWTSADAKAAARRIQASRTAAKRDTANHLVVTLPRLLPGLNGKNGLIRQNFRAAGKVKDELLEWAKGQRLPTFGDERVTVVCTRHYCGSPMDFDNAAASFKYLLDALVKAGVIKDDGPKIIEAMTFRQVRCRTKKEHRMTVEIKSCLLVANETALQLF